MSMVLDATRSIVFDAICHCYTGHSYISIYACVVYQVCVDTYIRSVWKRKGQDRLVLVCVEKVEALYARAPPASPLARVSPDSLFHAIPLYLTYVCM